MNMHQSAAHEQAEWERIKREETEKAEAEFNRPLEESVMARTKKAPADGTIEYPVTYGDVTIGRPKEGPKRARLGITISRGDRDIREFDRNLCGRRLRGVIIAAPNGAAPDQKALPGLDMEHKIEATFEIKRIGVKPDAVSAGLVFSLDHIDLEELAAFAQRDGRLVITDVATLDDEEDGDEDEET